MTDKEHHCLNVRCYGEAAGKKFPECIIAHHKYRMEQEQKWCGGSAPHGSGGDCDNEARKEYEHSDAFKSAHHACWEARRTAGSMTAEEKQCLNVHCTHDTMAKKFPECVAAHHKYWAEKEQEFCGGSAPHGSGGHCDNDAKVAYEKTDAFKRDLHACFEAKRPAGAMTDKEHHCLNVRCYGEAAGKKFPECIIAHHKYRMEQEQKWCGGSAPHGSGGDCDNEARKEYEHSDAFKSAHHACWMARRPAHKGAMTAEEKQCLNVHCTHDTMAKKFPECVAANHEYWAQKEQEYCHTVEALEEWV